MQIRDLIPWHRREHDLKDSREEDNPLVALQRDMNRVFDRFWSHFNGSGGGLVPFGGSPRVDVSETDDAVEVSVELPGLDEKDIDVSVTEDLLTIKGEKKDEHEEKRKGYYVSERRWGSFYRSIPLPPGVASDKAEASFKKGVLSVSLPKTTEAQAKVKKIEVKAA